MQFLDWYSDGFIAVFVLVLYSILLLAIVLNGARRIAPLARLLPAAAAWHFVVWAFIAFWLLPHYSATGQADATSYYNESLINAGMIRTGDWAGVSYALGSDIIPLITGVLFAPAGADIYGIAFFSATIGFCGCLYFCRAFSLWAPPDQIRRYSLLILFLPSFATWTSIFGKDSWIALGLGLASYGYSSMLRARAMRGLWHLALGMVIVTAIRSHIAVTVAAAMALAYGWGLTQAHRGSILSKVAIIAMLIAMAGTLVTVATKFVGVSDVSADGVADYVEARSAGNTGGGSDVQVQATPGALGALRAFPRGIVRVLFEPFPWEVNSFNSGLAALENLYILWFALNNARRLRGLIRGMAKEPFLLFSWAFALLVTLMLSLTPNLGLISRQRSQMLPFLFAPLVAAHAMRRRRPEFGPVYTGVAQPNLRMRPVAGVPASAPYSAGER